MDKVLGAIMGVFWGATFILMAIALGPLMGALAGWVVASTFLGEWVTAGIVAVLGKPVDLVHLGALLGFVGGFFRQTVNLNQ